MEHNYEWVDSNTSLQAAAAQWQGVSCMGIDTEFMREKTFYPLPGLIQLSDGERVWLIDPLGIDDWQPLTAFFAQDSVIKLLHSGSEDLELFSQMMPELPQPLLDTQTGAALTGLGAALSYQALVTELIGVDLEKGATRSDWLRRPLSEHQLGYAALDVLYLPQIYTELKNRLDAAGRFEWWRQEGQRDVLKVAAAPDFDHYYRRVKGVSRLPHQAQFNLQQLCIWREQEARARDLPRGWLVKDSVLLIIARAGEVPADLRSQLKNPREMPGAGIVVELNRVLEDCADAAPDAWPRMIQPSDSRSEKARMARLRAKIEHIAKDLGIAAETLASRKDLQAALDDAAEGRQASLSAWKQTLLAPLLTAEMENTQ